LLYVILCSQERFPWESQKGPLFYLIKQWTFFVLLIIFGDQGKIKSHSIIPSFVWYRNKNWFQITWLLTYLYISCVLAITYTDIKFATKHWFSLKFSIFLETPHKILDWLRLEVFYIHLSWYRTILLWWDDVVTVIYDEKSWWVSEVYACRLLMNSNHSLKKDQQGNHWQFIHHTHHHRINFRNIIQNAWTSH
jgi:hypothetical protein